jgi:acylphosphatase
MQDRLCMHYYVSGLVQGVCFRSFTQTEAKKVGLTGWVKNLPDGRVEVFVSGEREVVERFDVCVRRGPARAKVSDVQVETVDGEGYSDFLIL